MHQAILFFLSNHCSIRFRAHYVFDEDGVTKINSIYSHYRDDFCATRKPVPMNPTVRATFGKIVRTVFPSIIKRRLGPAGKQESYYLGLMIRNERLSDLDLNLKVNQKRVRSASTCLLAEPMPKKSKRRKSFYPQRSLPPSPIDLADSEEAEEEEEKDCPNPNLISAVADTLDLPPSPPPTPPPICISYSSPEWSCHWTWNETESHFSHLHEEHWAPDPEPIPLPIPYYYPVYDEFPQPTTPISCFDPVPTSDSQTTTTGCGFPFEDNHPVLSDFFAHFIRHSS